MDECIQQIQSLLITGNKKLFYFRPLDYVVQTGTALPPLYLTEEDNSDPTCVILPHNYCLH